MPRGNARIENGVFVSDSPAKTRRFAGEFVRQWPIPMLVVLTGEVGSGKTTFVRGVAEGLGMKHPHAVASPTFVLLRHYPTRPAICHADFYRLGAIPEPLWGEIDDALNNEAIVLLEWGDAALARYGDKSVLKINFSHLGKRERRIRWAL